MTEQQPNESEQPKTRVLMVDDHVLVREQLMELIRQETDLTVCGEAEDVATALALIRQQTPDLVILDLALKQSNGLDLLKEVKGLPVRPAVLVVSMHEETFYAQRALEAGAAGYISKADATVNFVSAIRRVLAGQCYLSERMVDQMKRKLARGGRRVTEGVPV